MSEEKEILYFKMNLLQAEIEMNAMIAENRMREVAGMSPAYAEDAFLVLVEKYGIHHNKFPF